MTKYLPKVNKELLIAIAGLVWLAAGINILRLGTPELIGNIRHPIVEIISVLTVFFIFFSGMFFKLVNKHSARIMRFAEAKIMILHFFDRKSYLIMAFMMTFGIWLRHSHLLPPVCIGVFYLGLGSALVGAGVYFLIRFYQVKKQPV